MTCPELVEGVTVRPEVSKHERRRLPFDTGARRRYRDGMRRSRHAGVRFLRGFSHSTIGRKQPRPAVTLDVVDFVPVHGE